MKDLTSRLRKRIEIEEPVQTPDGGGGFSTSWQNFATVWAEITPLRGSENFENGKLENIGNFTITIRYLEGMAEKMRVKSGTRIFNIRGIVDPDENKEILEIFAEEGVAI